TRHGTSSSHECFAHQCELLKRSSVYPRCDIFRPIILNRNGVNGVLIGQKRSVGYKQCATFGYICSPFGVIRVEVVVVQPVFKVHSKWDDSSAMLPLIIERAVGLAAYVAGFYWMF